MNYFFTVLVFTALFSSAVQADDISSILERQSRVQRPAPPSVIPYNYTVDLVASAGESKNAKAPFRAKLLINPSASPDNRVTIISTSSDDYHEEFEGFLEKMQNPETSAEELAEGFWCESADNTLFDEDGFAVISETASEAVIKPNRALMAEIMMDTDDDEDISKSERRIMKKMMERLDGEFVLSKPDAQLKSIKIWLTRPITIAVVAKIKEMEFSQSCALAPNGFPYIDSMTMHLTAQTLGVRMEENINIKISDLTLR